LKPFVSPVGSIFKKISQFVSSFRLTVYLHTVIVSLNPQESTESSSGGNGNSGNGDSQERSSKKPREDDRSSSSTSKDPVKATPQIFVDRVLYQDISNFRKIRMFKCT